MTNTKKFQGKIREHGYTIESLSKVIGLSRTGLFNKMHNKSEFTASEIAAIVKALSIDVTEEREIFFAQFVENKSTRATGED